MESALAQVPNRFQIACVQALNKGGAKLAEAQLKAAGSCLKSAATGKADKLGVPPQDQTAQACLTNDIKGKLLKTAAKITDTEAKRCLAEAEQLPDFGYTDEAALDLAARDAGLNIVADLFGVDFDAAVIVPATDVLGAKCQSGVLKASTKLFKTYFKTALTAKKNVLKCSLFDRPTKCDALGFAAATSSLELETAIFDVVDADPKGKIAKAAGGITKAASKSCTGAATPIVQAFPGDCSGTANALDLAACVDTVVRGRACLALNAFDGFARDCGLVTRLFLTPSMPALFTRASGFVTVGLDSTAPPSGFDVSLASDNPALAAVPASVSIAPGASDEMVAITTGTNVGVTTVRATGGDLPEATAEVTVTRRGFSVPLTLIGVGRAHDYEIVLDDPAPVGGATLDVTSLDPGVATVAPAQVVIPEGQTTASITIMGVTEATTSLVVDGLADGYESQTWALNATDDLVDLPSSTQLAQGVVTDVLVLIAPDPAPAGGGMVSVESADPGIVEVLTPTVFIPEGNFDGFVQVRALVQDANTEVIASLQGYAPDVMSVSTVAALNILESFSSFAEAETDSVFLGLRDIDAAFPAPVGGVTATLSSDNPDCVSVAASVEVAQGEAYETFDLSYGGVAATPCSATVTASNPTFGTDTVDVGVALPPDLGALSFSTSTGQTRTGAGLQQRYDVQLASGAHGGVTLQIESSDPTKALLAPDPTTVGQPVIEVPVADLATSASVWVQGLPGVLGSSTVSVRQARFTEGSIAADVEVPVLDLVNLATSYSVSSIQTIADDNFQARTGVRNAAGNALQFEQVVNPLAAPLDVTISSSNVAVAELFEPLESGASVVLPLAANVSRTPASFAAGGVLARYDPPTDGVTTIEATAPNFELGFPSAEKDVTVNVSPATITVTDTTSQLRVGSGLQVRYRVTLSGGDHGGITVRVTSDDPGVALVAAADGVSVGAGFIDLVFADQDTLEDFYVQGVAGVTGNVTLTATSAGFTDGMINVDVEEPVLDLLALQLTHTTSTVQSIADDPFQVRAGIRNVGGTAFGAEQSVSAAAGPLTVTVTSSDVGVVQVGTSGGSGASAMATVAVNLSRTPASLATGGVQAEFDPTSTGTATITATAPGFAAGFDTADDDISVTVNPATITVIDTTSQNRVGAGLQTRYRVTLSGGDHGGVTVRVTSDDPGVALVAASDGVSGGAGFVDLVFADQDTFEDFFLQGVAGSSGNVTLTASAPGFTDGLRAIDVEEPVLDILSLATSHVTTTVQSIANDLFQVRTGIRNVGGTAFGAEQPVSAASGALTVTTTSDNVAVAQVGNSGGSGASVMATVAVNTARTPASLGLGGLQVEFDPTETGVATVTATAPGFAAGFDTADEDITVTVNPATITVADTSSIGRIGAGLQVRYRVTLSGGDHGGVTVRVTSSAPGVVLVGPADGVTAGASFVDLIFADQDVSEDFFVQGVVAASGSATLTAAAPGFSDDVLGVDVEQPVLDFVSLGLTHTITTVQSIADDPFQVRTGIRNVAGTGFAREQVVSAAAGSLTVTATSDDVAVAQVGNSGGSGASAMVTIPVNASRTPASVATGGLEVRFDPTSTGTATITATAPGYLVGFDNADEDIVVTVNPATMNVTDTTSLERVGAGLQVRYRVTLSGGEHGGVTVRVAGDDPDVLLIAPDPTTVGTSFLDLVFADLETTKDFYVQGVLSETGNVLISGSAPGFVDGSVAVDVEAPVLDILALTSLISSAAADDPFQIRAGIPNAAFTAFQTEQAVSPGNAPLTVTVESSAPGVGQLVTTSSTGSPVTAEIAAGEARTGGSVAVGGVAFDPLSGGSTDVSASAVGFSALAVSDTQSVTVNP